MNAAVKRLDVICIGRVAVDLYAQQIGSRLEDVASFAKYLGGSSGNVAFGTAIQGLKSAMLARVGDEHNGRFLRETLNRAGVDTEYLITDKSRLTALSRSSGNFFPERTTRTNPFSPALRRNSGGVIINASLAGDAASTTESQDWTILLL